MTFACVSFKVWALLPIIVLDIQSGKDKLKKDKYDTPKAVISLIRKILCHRTLYYCLEKFKAQYGYENKHNTRVVICK